MFWGTINFHNFASINISDIPASETGDALKDITVTNVK